MNFRKWFNLLFAALFVLSLLPGAALAQDKPAAQPPATIESDVLTALAAGPADFFVEMEEEADLSKAAEIKDWSARGWYVYNTLRAVADRSQAKLIEYAKSQGLTYHSRFSANAVYIEGGMLENALMIASLPGVSRIRLPRDGHIDPQEMQPAGEGTNAYGWNMSTLDPDNNLYGMQAAQVWDTYGVKGGGIVVANIDTGVTYTHPALNRQYRGNNGDGTFDHDFNWYQPNTSGNCGDGTYPCDHQGHGSGTAGIMVGETADLAEQNGAAPEAKWIACMGCDGGTGCSELALTGCGDWYVAPCPIGSEPGDLDCDPDMRPHIINNSWGGGSCDNWYDAYVDAWVAAGMFPAFSAGNTEACNSLGSPGDTPAAFGTAAHNSTGGNLYAGGPSCYYPNPTCVPEAHDIDPHLNAPTFGRTPNNGTGYYMLSGTSGASPHTAGAVALIWSANPGLIGQIDETFTILEQSTNHDVPAGDCGKPACAGAEVWPNYEYGWGYLDAFAAVTMGGVGEMAWLDGTVTEAGTGTLLPGVTVVAENVDGMTWDAVTDSSGYYTMTLMVGTYDVTAEGPAHGPSTVTGVEVVIDTVTTQDFALDPKGLLHGYVTDQDSGAPLEATVTVQQTGDVVATDATGYYEVYLGAGTYDVTAAAPDYASETVQVILTVGAVVQQDFSLLAAVSVTPDPIAITLELGQTGNVAATLINNMSVDYPFEFSVRGVAAKQVMAEDVLLVAYDTSSSPVMGAALTAAGYSYLEVTNSQFTAMTVDQLLEYQAVFYAGIPYSTEQPLLMAYLDAGGSLYVSDNDLGWSQGSTTFYQTYLQATYVSDNGGDILTGEDIMAGLTLDISADPYPDSFTVGAEGTRIFQFSGDNAGGVAVDRNGYKAIYTDWDWYYFTDPVMGAEIVGRSMDYLAGSDALWFVPDITSGTVPANNTLGWTNNFYATAAAGIYQPGVYNALLKIKPTTGGLPEKEVSVVMTVTPPASFGQVEGVVTSEVTGLPLEADILIEATDGTTWTLTTDPDTGYYSYWLDAGTYDVTASAPDHASAVASVTIAAGATTVQDFELLGVLTITPDVLEATLELNTTATAGAVMTNNGLVNYPFEFQVIYANQQEILAEDVLLVQKDPTMAAAMATALTEAGYSSLGVTDAAFAAMTVDQLLEYGAVFYAGTSGYSGSPTASENLLVAYLDAGGSLYISDNDLGYYRNSSVFYTTYLQATYVGDDPGIDTLIGEGIMAGLTVDISADGYPDHFTVNADGSRIFQYQDGNAAGVAVDREGFKAVYTSWDFQNILDANQEIEVIGRIMGFLAGAETGWFEPDIMSGTVPALGTVAWDNTFYATAAAGIVQPGVYQATLRVKPTIPDLPRYDVPVVMTVTAPASFGFLEGTVTTDRPGGPIEANILIEASDGTTVALTTDPTTGYYSYWLDNGAYDVSATVDGYLPQTVAVTIVAQQTTVQDFLLILDAPDISVTPTSMEETLVFGETAQQTLTIVNSGIGEANVEIGEVDLGVIPLVHIPPFTGELPDDGVPTSIERAPQTSGVQAALTGEVINANPAYAFDIYTANQLFNIPDLDSPDTWTSIGGNVTTAYAGDFAFGDFSTLYVINSDMATLYAVDTATGASTSIGSVAVGGATWTGLSFDTTTGTMYGTATDGSTQTLYTVDLDTGALTTIGTTGSYALIIDIAFVNGQLYGVDIGTDEFVAIDKDTAAVTAIGSTGFSANYAQGLDYDEQAGIMYWAAYGSAGELRVIDIDTGASAQVGGFAGGTEVDAFAIPTGGGGDVPWLAETPVSVTVPAFGSVDILVDFDSGMVTEPGTWLANLAIATNDPYHKNVMVPVTMTVQPSADLGKLEGVVTSDRPGGPLAADILIEGSGGQTWTTMANSAGYYYHWFLSGSYTVTASFDGYLPESAVVQITGMTTTTQDFELVLNQPDIAVTPLSIDDVLTMGESAVHMLTIANTGVAPLDFEITERDEGMIPLIHIPAFTGELPDDGVPQSVGRAPQASGAQGAEPSGIVINANPAYAFDIYTANQLFNIPDLDNPGVWNNLGGSTISTVYAGDFANGDFETLYAIDSDMATLYAVDTTTGIGTAIGSVAVGGATWTGLAFDNDTGLMYGTATDGSTQTLYTVDLDTGALTTIGTTTGGYALIIDIAFVDGQMYGVDIGTDEFVAIDKDTCAVTAIGSTGFSANYAQGLDYDEVAEVMYWAAYGSAAELRVIDINTGASASVGSFPSSTEVDSFAIPMGGGGGDVIWLSESPVSGTVPAGSSLDVEITLDSSVVAEPGEYHATLRLANSDPYEKIVMVPVTMVVLPAGDIGRLEGTVTGTGYCDGESYPLEAELLIENSAGDTWTVTSDDAGYYYRWLEPGDYTVTASAPGHVDAVDVATVSTGVTTTLDLALRLIESCMDVTPLEFSVSMPADAMWTETLSIVNNGAGDLLWEIRETTATLQLVNEDVLVKVPAIAARTGLASRLESVAQPAREFTVHVGWVSAEPIDVLIVTPDVAGGGDISLILSTLAAFPDLNVVVWDGTVGTPTVADMQAYDVVLLGNDILWTSSAIDKTMLSNNLADYIDAGGKVLVSGFIWSYDDWGMGGGRFMTEDYSPFEMSTTDIWDPTTLGTYDDQHPIMAGISNVTDNFNHQDPALSSTGTWVASWADGENFVAVSPNCVGLNQMYFHTADFGGQVGELLHNALLYLGAGAEPWVDVPWVSEVPTNGVTLPYETFDVDVVFDSTGLTLGECYTASLGILHDDPGWDSPTMIPLELCIAAPAFTLAKEASVATALPGDQVEFTLTFNNTGDPVDGVSIVDTLPEGVVFVEASDGGVYDDATGTVVWDDLTVGSEVMVLTVVVQVGAETEPGTLTNVASLTWLGEEYATDSAEFVVEEAPPPYHYYYLPMVFRN